MPKYLVIVESPTKEKTISKILGPDFTVKSSYGHVRDLPKSQIGVDTEHDFQPKYISNPKAKKLLKELRKYSDKAETVYLATDYDREGEAIAWHLQESLGLEEKDYSRITFHEITPDAIKDSLKHSRKIDHDLVDSQQARRILDRLVGYKLSPLLWRKIKYGLSAGRVQSVAVRLICDREDEIEAFNSVEYWSIEAELKKQKGPAQVFTAGLVSKNDKKFDKMDFKDKAMADNAMKELEGASYIISKIESKERRRAPFAPYTTSSMQMDASRRLGFSASRTMKIAQTLYEGISLGQEGNVGLITYMRTDSLNIADVAKKEAKKYIETSVGEKFYPSKPRVYKTKAKGAQEAHEAIRPTSAFRTPESLKNSLSEEQYKLYDLIWRRFLASQMEDAVYDTMAVDIKAGEYLFRANGRTLKFSGFLEVYKVADQEDEKDKEKEETLPPLSEKELLDLVKIIPEQHFTEPPPRFNEASLIKALEEHGIGRPSTYAPTINTILERTYVRLEQKRFFPTNLGRVVNDALKKHFPGIVDVQFTASIEEQFDKVAEGEAKWTKVVGDFYGPFSKDLEKAEVNLERRKVEPQKTNEVCPKCGKTMVLRDSRKGQFLACSGFPECRTTFSIDKEGNKIVRPEPEVTEYKCEKCGRAMLKRVGKRGPFLACSGFPKCRNIKKYPGDAAPAPEKDPEPGK